MGVNAWGITHKGMVRAQNQDSFFLHVLHEDNQAIVAVCDGMGGARAGNVASELALDTFVSEVRRMLKPNVNAIFLRQMLESAVTCANKTVFEKAMSGEAFSGMGTTLVGAIVTEKKAVITNVGDSRAYHISAGGIARITKDHSLVEDLLEKGDLTYEEARSHPSKNLITRAMGTDPSVDCDLYQVSVEPGEFLLLCSDGLTNVVDDQEILFEVLHGGEPAQSCTQLVELACARGGPDNITVVLVSV